MESSIDRFGRLLIPKSLRHILGLGSGIKVQISVRGSSLVIEAIEPRPQFEVAPDGLPLLHGKADTDINFPLKSHREGRHRKLEGTAR